MSKGGKLKFALVGCGAIAEKHAIAIGRLENTEVVGAYDIDPKVMDAFEKKHSIPVYSDVEKLIDETSPDILNILTPSGDHAKRILDLSRFGRDFVVEKPLALNLDDVDRVLEVCGRNGLGLFVVKQNRFNPPLVKLKEAIQGGRFGKLVLGTVRVRWKREQAYYEQKPWRGTWAFDGGVMTNQASHHIDALLWMMGEVESVMAMSATQLVDIEAEDTGVAMLRFRNGALGIVEATTATRPADLEGSISVLGEKGSVEVGGFFMNELKTWNFSEPNDMDGDVWTKFSKVPSEKAWNHTEFFKDVVRSKLWGEKALIDGLEGRKSIELINAVYESVETGKEISLRFRPRKCRLGIMNDK